MTCKSFQLVLLVIVTDFKGLHKQALKMFRIFRVYDMLMYMLVHPASSITGAVIAGGPGDGGDGGDEQVIEVTDDGRNIFLFATKLRSKLHYLHPTIQLTNALLK